MILGQFLQNSAIEKSEKELKSPKEMEKKSQRVEKTLEDKRKDCLKEKWSTVSSARSSKISTKKFIPFCIMVAIGKLSRRIVK